MAESDVISFPPKDVDVECWDEFSNDEINYIGLCWDEIAQPIGFYLCEQFGIPKPWSDEGFWYEIVDKCSKSTSAFANEMRNLLATDCDLNDSEKLFLLKKLAVDLKNLMLDPKYLTVYVMMKNNTWLYK